MTDATIHEAGQDDAVAAGRLLFDFNTEYDDPTPPPDALAVRLRELLAAGDTRIVLGGAGPDGIAVLRFRPALWSQGLECYLAELYVAPARRGQGLGRALMEAAIALARDAGADTMDLGTNETDTAARALYESLGFTQLEDGTPNLCYEREL
jgi:ribosomal protein S18 acetylase RimI-like enzyme